MKPETNLYIKKRQSIIDIITSIDVEYSSDEIYLTITPSAFEAREAAEKILSKFGINRPNEITQKESKGIMYTAPQKSEI